ncbi:MAG: glycosyltransferase family 1 protein [Deltaproteobacteria bacterium]|nr:MAG: glycosyltransferase family 1 protein [Deltaproteobacteria bacterium]
MKITILYKFRNTAWGGANQFLHALRNWFVSKGCYEEDPFKADVGIFISYPFNNEDLFGTVHKLKKNTNTLIVNRMNGPIFLYRDQDVAVDKMNFIFNRHVADGTIFQSKWSMEQCHKLGMIPNGYETIIGNAPDPGFFYRPDPSKNKVVGKTKIVAASWSDNYKKGFDTYQYLDDNLDFARFEMTFIGRSPIIFKNINQLPILQSDKLAETFRDHDMFVFASKVETCSNILMEALHCGLPAVARNNSSQPELLGTGGLLFNDTRDVLDAINKVSNNLNYYRSSIKVPTIDEIGANYYNFCNRIYSEYREGKYTRKCWSNMRYYGLTARAHFWEKGTRIKNKLRKINENGNQPG